MDERDEQNKECSNNAKALDILCYALNADEFIRISSLKMPKNSGIPLKKH